MKMKTWYELSSINLMLRMLQMKRAEHLDQFHLHALQQQRFKKLLKYVVAHSEFYRDYYREHGIRLDQLDQVRLEDLPIIDKKIVMEHFDQLVCDRNLKKADLERFLSDPEMIDKKYMDRYEVTHTSGSSGRIGIFVHGPKDWTMLKALSFTRISQARILRFRKTRYAFIGVIDGHYAGISISRSGPKSVVNFLPLDINWPMTKISTELNSFQPDVLSGYSSGVYQLALEQQKGRLQIKPEKIICSADPLTEQMAEVIHQAFGIKPSNCYAATEAIGMAAECDNHHGLHLFNDWHIFEVINPYGNPVEPGEPGTLVVTNLLNYTQPLIRYRMDDSVVLAENGCSCGWSFPRLKTIEGRNEEYLRFEWPDGHFQLLHPIVFVEFFVAGLEKLQIVQVARNQLKLNVILAGDEQAILARIRAKMDQVLQSNQLADFVRYEINPVQEIPNDQKTGKFKLIIPV